MQSYRLRRPGYLTRSASARLQDPATEHQRAHQCRCIVDRALSLGLWVTGHHSGGLLLREGGCGVDGKGI